MVSKKETQKCWVKKLLNWDCWFTFVIPLPFIGSRKETGVKSSSLGVSPGAPATWEPPWLVERGNVGAAEQQKQRNSSSPPVSCQLLCCLDKVSFPNLASLGDKGSGTRAASTESWEAPFQLLPVWWFWVCSCTASILDGS